MLITRSSNCTTPLVAKTSRSFNFYLLISFSLFGDIIVINKEYGPM